MLLCTYLCSLHFLLFIWTTTLKPPDSFSLDLKASLTSCYIPFIESNCKIVTSPNVSYVIYFFFVFYFLSITQIDGEFNVK